MQIIARFYANDSQARNAQAALVEAGLPPSRVFLIAAGEEGASGGQAAAQAMIAGYEIGSAVKEYADRVKRGESLLVVDPPYGLSQKATDVVDSFDPLNKPSAMDEDLLGYTMSEKRAAPFSTSFGWKLIKSNEPAPFSDFWGLALKTRHKRSWLSRTFGEIGDPHYQFSRMFGLGLLSNKAAPLSSLFALPTKSGSTGPAFNSSMGLPLLSKGPAPLSSALGLPLLSRKRLLY